ncbi:MAG: RagB/SusD family nutrient uptake outer membrane protein [Petrimonas sp.]|nr:RagB/SusD family nutrient uptake outer membrane protein [Petrimonas sp.]
MRKIIYVIAFALSFSLLHSCADDFLDQRPDERLDEQQVFERYNRVSGLVTELYNNAKSGNHPLVFFNHFSSSAVTDECEGSTVEGSLTNLFNSGAWSPSGMPDRSSCGQYWWDLWTYVRRANVVIEGVKKYNTPDDPLQPGNLQKRIGEAYFMRAYYHYLLIRMYGEIPYLDYLVDPQNIPEFKKESFHTIVEKICADADTAFQKVPAKVGDDEFGRIEKGMCLGLKAMVRWMAATPMWNGGNFPNDTREFKNEYTYDPQRWVKARDAAKAVLDFKVEGVPRYSLYYGNYGPTDFENDQGKNENNSKVRARLWAMFYDMQSFKQEWVFFVTRDKYEAWQGDVYPPSWGGGSRQMPVQEQVDEYEYIAPDGYGYPIYANRAKVDGYDDGNPYESVQRDPRFYRDIMYHGSTFKNNKINTAEGTDKIGNQNSTTTGYFLRKFLREGWNRNYGFQIHAPAIWRLPEFIYIYAEAVNEISGPTKEIYDMINEIRARSFMAPMPPTVLTDKKLMKEYIQRERRVELFYENNRIWNTRLYLDADNPDELAKEETWKAAGSDNDTRSQNYWPYPKTQRMINGMRPVEDPNGQIEINGKKYRMERFWIEDRVFVTPRHYLFPIMADELKRTPTITQNPGW